MNGGLTGLERHEGGSGQRKLNVVAPEAKGYTGSYLIKTLDFMDSSLAVTDVKVACLMCSAMYPQDCGERCEGTLNMDLNIPEQKQDKQKRWSCSCRSRQQTLQHCLTSLKDW
ncbi:uncharacterized protein LOC109072976 isoform X2 [Cyprinus carpio]|uniref:Uncharacterized protein LOC109072976 isoform X2 n=1 Tax=Cyprinus carpio TaxID=7962 RepID=A0A9Q9XZ79_CYPCA|nr:uncharacterized protein LOC109072976 isoform X2 [Cyprinus carpio]